MQETQEMHVWFLGREDTLEAGMAAHSSILAWKIPWTEEPGGLQSMGLQRVRHSCSNWEEQSKIKKNYSPATPKVYILYFGKIWEYRPVRQVKKKETMDSGTSHPGTSLQQGRLGVQRSCTHLKAALNQPVLEPAKVRDAKHHTSILTLLPPYRRLSTQWPAQGAPRGLGGPTVPVFLLQNSLPCKAWSVTIHHSLPLLKQCPLSSFVCFFVCLCTES